MRSHEQRAAAVRRRVQQLQRQRRRSRRVLLAAGAACLAILAGLSALLAGAAGRLRQGEYAAFGAAASIFSGRPALGYFMIGLLAFLLGVSVTLLCLRIRVYLQEDDETGDDDGRTD